MNEPLRLPCQHICIGHAPSAARLGESPRKGALLEPDWTRLRQFIKKAGPQFAATARAPVYPPGGGWGGGCERPRGKSNKQSKQEIRRDRLATGVSLCN